MKHPKRPLIASLAAATALALAPAASAAATPLDHVAGATAGHPAAASTTQASAIQAAATAGQPEAAVAPDIDVKVVQGYLHKLQQIADEHDGNRATGTSGFTATQNFVRSTLKGAGYDVTEQKFDTSAGESSNLVAELPGSDPDQVVMVGAHLDSVQAGPGINDNGSGSAGELATAVAMAKADKPTATIRFTWFGGEEDGLLGSQHYVDSASQADLDKISGFLNFDMIGSPNPGYFVYDDDPEIEGNFQKFFADKGIATEPEEEGDGRSDHAPFKNAGVPLGGLFSGADWTKTADQAEAWGGTEGEAFDACYHASCDTIDNVDETVLDDMSDAMASAVWQLSRPVA